MTGPDLPVEGPPARPGTSDHQFDSAVLTEAHRDSERASRTSPTAALAAPSGSTMSDLPRLCSRSPYARRHSRTCPGVA